MTNQTDEEAVARDVYLRSEGIEWVTVHEIVALTLSAITSRGWKKTEQWCPKCAATSPNNRFCGVCDTAIVLRAPPPEGA